MTPIACTLVRALVCAALATVGLSAHSDMVAAQRWVDTEFKLSSLGRAQQLDEMRWFVQTGATLQQRGVRKIRVVSEDIATHNYESRVLARAFEDITGIAVEHEITSEGALVDQLYTAMQSGGQRYDGWISDSDLIGTHYRYGAVIPLTDYMQGEGREFTNPTLDLDDFIGLKFTTAPDGKLYQLRTSRQTCTGSVRTGLPARIYRRNSRPVTAIRWGYR
jgi:glycerol transport system substrate-binding protein